MRFLFHLAAFAAALGIAVPAGADAFKLTGSVTAVPTCASGGGSSVSVPRGEYILTVTTADANVCLAATCVTGGMALAVGTQIPISIHADRSVSCRSDAGGVVQFLVAERIR